jgi:hypothetical protein
VPVAVNCWLSPAAIVALAGLTSMELSVTAPLGVVKTTSTQKFAPTGMVGKALAP